MWPYSVYKAKTIVILIRLLMELSLYIIMGLVMKLLYILRRLVERLLMWYSLLNRRNLRRHRTGFTTTTTRSVVSLSSLCYIHNFSFLARLLSLYFSMSLMADNLLPKILMLCALSLKYIMMYLFPTC